MSKRDPAIKQRDEANFRAMKAEERRAAEETSHEVTGDLMIKYRAERDEARAMLNGVIGEIAAERRRQIEGEGWTPEHDDQHRKGEIAAAAGVYALGTHVDDALSADALLNFWPWSREWWKPKGRRRDLIRAAALIVAEIERIDRAAQ